MILSWANGIPDEDGEIYLRRDRPRTKGNERKSALC